jgi:tetratricopeptide (TPR) repeat protein
VAEAVLPDRFVPDVVTRLRDRSWLEVVRGAPSLVRLSATVRAFATLRGTETHRGAVRAALADWVATEDTVDQDRSLDLVRGLLEHGVELRPAVRARLAGMAAQALRIGGALVTALALVKDAMDRGVGGVEGAKIRRIYGELLGVTGSPADALTHLGLLLEQTSDDAERTSLQLARGVVLRHLGRLPEARAAARDAVDHAGAHTLLRGSALHALAVTDESVARELYSEVVTLAERHGEPRLAALARFNQAVWLQDRGRLPEAEVRYADVLADRAVEPLLRITGQRNLAALRSTRGDEAGARHLIDRAIGLARAAGRRRLEASCELVRADIELHAGNLQECDVRCRELLRTAPTQDTETLAQTRLVRGAAAWCAGRAAEAVAWFDEAIERADRSASPRSAALGRVLRVCAGAGDLAGVTPAVAALDDPQLTALFDVARGLEAARAGRHHDAADIAARLRAGPAETYRDLHWALPQLEAQVAKTT